MSPRPPQLSDLAVEQPLDKHAYKKALNRLQKQLAHVQSVSIGRKRRAIVAVEGWDAAGKGGFIQRLTSPWDPRFFDVIPIRAPTAEEKARHYLWRFWCNMPALGEVNIFDRTWYGRVLVERIEGFASEVEWRRAYDEINAFEALLAAEGTTLIKLFFDVSDDEQDRRLIKRLETPWKRWKISAEDFRNRARRAEYRTAADEMFARTEDAAPWRIVSGDDKRAARIAALAYVVERLADGLDMAPPDLDPDLAKMARAAFGAKLNNSK